MFKILLDAGHYGYYNPGVNPEYFESIQMWKLHQYLKIELQKYEDVMVDTTRIDINHKLDNRQRGLLGMNADLLISMHSNAADDENIGYVVAYCGINHKADDIATKMTKAVSKVFDTISTPRINHKESDTRPGKDFYAILGGANDVSCPAFIMEHGFHTNSRQCNLMLDDDFLMLLAKVEAETIAEHYGLQFKVVDIQPGWNLIDNDTWRYYTSVNVFVQNDWCEINGEWYWFDGSGVMISNTWYHYKDNWYFFDAEGKMVRDTEPVLIHDDMYIFNADGTMRTDDVAFTYDETRGYVLKEE